MPHDIRWESHGVLLRFSGDVSDADVLESRRAIQVDERFADVTYMLVHLGEVTALSVATDTIRVLASLDQAAAARKADVRIALVTGDATALGLSNVYGISHEVSGGTWQTAVFPSEAEARAWVAARE